MILNLALDLPEDLSYLRMARELGRTVLTTLQATETDILDVDTMISELYSNVLRHGQSDEGRFQIILEFGAEKLVIFVVDRGKGFAFKNVAAPGTLRPDFNGGERIGGFGLKLVEALADHVEFRRADAQGTMVRAEKTIHYKSNEALEKAYELERRQRQADSEAAEEALAATTAG